MKRLFVISLIAAVMAASAPISHARKDGHVLEKLWNSYSAASDADRPQEMTEVLGQIRDESFRRRLAWDYYDSSVKYVEAAARRNWKLRDSLNREVREGLADFGSPLLVWLYDLETYSVSQDSLYNYIVRNASVLRKDCNRSVYSGCSPFEHAGPLRRFSVLAGDLISNDYEFVLWSLWLRRYNPSDRKGNVYGLLKALYEGTYPHEALMNYATISHVFPISERRRMLEDMKDEYAEKAAGLIAVQDLLRMELDEMEGVSESEDYLAFREKLRSLEKIRSSFRGNERRIADCCTGALQMLEELDSKKLSVCIKDSEAEFLLRNMERLRVRVTAGDTTVLEQWLYNQKRSFYAYDTLRMSLAGLDDGEYVVRCSDGHDEVGRYLYEKNTLSVAYRDVSDDDGMLKRGIYVTDYKTGKPFRSVDVSLYDTKGKLVYEEDAVDLEGFTDIPMSFYDRIEAGSESNHHLIVSVKEDDGRFRRSRTMTLPQRKPSVFQKYGNGVASTLMFDRNAFNPGDTVKCKAVLYQNGKYGDMKVIGSGLDVSLELRDSKGEIMETRSCRTNEYGSVAGEFVLDGVERNGRHSITVVYDDRPVGKKFFTVDEYVLPDFDLEFEKSDSLYLVGDTVTLYGTVRSYSGHPLTSAHVRYTVSLNGDPSSDGVLEIGPDGRFKIMYVAETESGNCYASVEVRVTDDTGETYRFVHTEYFSSSLYPHAEVTNAVGGGIYYWPAGTARDTVRSKCIVDDDVLNVLCELKNERLRYSLTHEGEAVHEGTVMSGDTLSLDISSLPSGIYQFALTSTGRDGYGRTVTGASRIEIFRTRTEDESVAVPVDYMFRPLEGGDISFQAGSGVGPLWAVAELFGEDSRLLDTRNIMLGGASGEERTLMSYAMGYCSGYPDVVKLVVTGFRNGKVIRWIHDYERPVEQDRMSVVVERMDDRTGPGQECRISLRSNPETEILAAVFDKSTERIQPNEWRRVYDRRNFLSIHFNALPGADYYSGETCLSTDGLRFQNKAAGNYVSVEEEYEAIPFVLADSAMESVEIRDEFASTLAFEPFIRPDEEGLAELRFRTSDKLSTYVISLFAHDKNMNNTVQRREMLVTLPLKVSLREPGILYAGDRYVLNASVSNSSDRQIDGVITLEVYDGAECEGMEPLQTHVTEVSIEPMGNASAGFAVDVPSGTDALGFRLVFVADKAKDGVFVTVPVNEPVQELVEAHSAVLLPDISREDVMDSLKAAFVNVSALGAEYKELKLSELLTEALPLSSEEVGRDLVSQCNFLYVNLLGYELHSRFGTVSAADLLPYAKAAMEGFERILDYVRPDGGFAWLSGMKSSPVMTAFVLESFAALRDRRLLDVLPELFGEDCLDDFDEAVRSAVLYLDSSFFTPAVKPDRIDRLSLCQYLHVRSCYAGVPFDQERAKSSLGAEAWKDFTGSVNSVLAPGKRESRTGADMPDKVRMMRMLMNLEGSEAGMRLASSWGVAKSSRMSKAFHAELMSLIEYAVAHPDGGWYYPNAVLPWRGLLESEAYVHSMICDLYRDVISAGGYGKKSFDDEDMDLMTRISDGIRIWIMLQNETQQWAADPGFMSAAASVYDGSDDVRDTRILVMKKRYARAFDEIASSGNGMKISVDYYLEAGDGMRNVIAPGDSLRVGDKVVAVYSLWSRENRSFVRMSVPRAACLRPEEQLSGWQWRMYRFHGGMSPQCYREVKSDRTVYWMDVCPEEHTVIEEDMFVTQEGVFITPVHEVECLYAPHYRANGKGGMKFYVNF